MDNNGQQSAAPAQPQIQPNAAPEPPPSPSPPAPTEDDEWTGATADYLLDKGRAPETPAKKAEDERHDPNVPKDSDKPEGEEKGGTPEPNPDDKKPDAEQGAGDDSKKEAGDDKPDEGQPDAQPTRAELEADRKQTIQEVREHLYPDLPTRLEDADGDPIETIEDVQRLINPNTGKQFTTEEAAAWLLAAQQNLNKQIKEADQKVEQIAEVHLSLKDQAARIKQKWGELLKANPNGIREKAYASYQKTLKLDEKSKIIIDAPVNMEEYYDTLLEPYERRAAQMETDEAKKAEEEAKAKQQQQAQAKTQTRSDRQDVIGAGKPNAKDPEEAEWEQAAKNYYEG